MFLESTRLLVLFGGKYTTKVAKQMILSCSLSILFFLHGIFFRIWCNLSKLNFRMWFKYGLKAVSVLVSCLPSTLPSSILPGKVAEKVLWLHASTWRRILKWFNQATQVVQSASSDVSVSWCRRLDKLTDTSPLAYAVIFVTRCSHICNPMQPYSWISFM